MWLSYTMYGIFFTGAFPVIPQSPPIRCQINWEECEGKNLQFFYMLNRLYDKVSLNTKGYSWEEAFLHWSFEVEREIRPTVT